MFNNIWLVIKSTRSRKKAQIQKELKAQLSEELEKTKTESMTNSSTLYFCCLPYHFLLQPLVLEQKKIDILKSIS